MGKAIFFCSIFLINMAIYGQDLNLKIRCSNVSTPKYMVGIATESDTGVVIWDTTMVELLKPSHFPTITDPGGIYLYTFKNFLRDSVSKKYRTMSYPVAEYLVKKCPEMIPESWKKEEIYLLFFGTFFLNKSVVFDTDRDIFFPVIHWNKKNNLWEFDTLWRGIAFHKNYRAVVMRKF